MSVGSSPVSTQLQCRMALRVKCALALTPVPPYLTPIRTYGLDTTTGTASSRKDVVTKTKIGRAPMACLPMADW